MNIVICDDDKSFCKIIYKKINEILPDADLFVCHSGEELFKLGSTIDIILLDIEMPNENGMDIARKLRKINKNTILIFTTGLKDYVFEAFDVRAFHYLVKPFSDEKLEEVIKKARAEYLKENNKKEKTILIKQKGMNRRVIVDNIIYAEVFNRIIIIHEADEAYEYYGKLSELENVAGSSFFRIHRSYLINMKYIEKYDSKRVLLEKNIELPMAKGKYPLFIKAYLRFNKYV